MYLYPGNITNDSADDLLQEAISISSGKSKSHVLLDSEDEKKARKILEILKEYKPSIVMEHSLFAILINPNVYLYRFIGRFPGNLALFEFFDNDEKDICRLKAETRSAFEDSLFSYLLGDTKRAYSGFRTVTRLNPLDSVAFRYMTLCEKQLENTQDSDV